MLPTAIRSGLRSAPTFATATAKAPQPPAGTFTMPSLVGVIDSATMSGTGVADAMNPNEPVAGCLLRHGELSERKVVG